MGGPHTAFKFAVLPLYVYSAMCICVIGSGGTGNAATEHDGIVNDDREL